MTEKEFVETIREKTRRVSDLRALADRLVVSHQTLKLWAAGENLPHPVIRERLATVLSV